MLSKPDLFARLAEGHAAGITVVTPNARLSQALVADFDVFQAKNDKTVWEAADILPIGAFVERLWEDALYSDAGETLPLLLTPSQEQQLWEQTLEKSGLLAVPQAAAQCRDAWRLQHAWRTGNAPGNDDATAFLSWSRDYQRRTKGQVDAARLPDLIVDFLQKKPKLLVAYAFDIVPPQAKAFFSHFEFEECQPETVRGSSIRTSYPSSREELESAAKWARARLEQGGSRIAVVVPHLEKRRKEVIRVFSRVMQPGFNLPAAEKAARPFNVSLGLPLHDYPIVHAALGLLELSRDALPFETVSRLIRSPFIAGAESERARRAALDVHLRKNLEATVSLPKLIANVERAPLLRGALERLFAAAQEDLLSDKTPSGWARRFSGLLEAAGFPGERALDSDEFQARAKLNEVLAEFAKLERVSQQFSFPQAFQALKRLCADTLFQPESQGAPPIQVLGILESAGLEFDHLWVSGLTDEAWPLRARPNPFLPIALQRKAGIPEATAESSLALDRRITGQWRSAAKEVVFSHYEKDEDRELAPSPLILGVPKDKVDVPAFPRLRDLVFSHKKLSTLNDSKGPPVTEKQIRGGTKVLSDQAACPFRAFARHRLAAEKLEEPVEGLDASRRGSLLHELMKHLWGSLKNSQSLEGDTARAIEAAADAAVKELELEGRFAELERARLARLAREWLEIERLRPGFSVVSLEEKRTIAFAGLEFSARIDRMDQLSTGGHALIDYKTSRNPSPKHWEPPRPDDPQLPLYAVSAKEEVAAVAFAKVRPGEMRFMGFSRDDKALPKVQKAKAWQPLLRAWKDEAESLGAAFAAGEARVDPKRDLLTCRYCGLETLCRVYEKINVLAEAEEGEE